MKDMKTKKIVLAVCMVALMLAVAVVPAIQGPTDADATVTHNFSDSYMYVITLDGTSTEKINDVQVSVNGSALTSQKSYDGTNKGVSYIKDFWKFDSDTGLGPFNSFYAAVNLTSGTAKIGDEDKIASDAGQIAFVLDPNNLKKTRGGTNLTSCLDQFNIMLIIPTVYWKASDDGTKLYISNSASYTASGESTVTDMVAYAHIANPLDDGGRTHTTDGKTPYPYIGIGVYEASVADGKLYSKSGKYPAAWASNDTFVGYAQAQTAASAATGSAYQQWNFYQWTLYKIMSYSVMGTKNSQQMIGNGYTDIGGSETTGASDASGAYYSTSARPKTAKLFIENSWGCREELVGDTCFSEGVLFTGNTLGGATLGTSSSPSGNQTTNGVTLPSSNGWITGTSKASATWDLPTARISYDNSGSMNVPGDYVVSDTGWRSLSVGGYIHSASGAGVARADADSSPGNQGSATGTRLAYVMTADAAVGLADAFTKIQSRWTVDPAGEAGLVYSGIDQALATAGTVNGGTPKYSLDNTDWSTSVPSAANAGTYTVYYKIEADADHWGLAAQSFTVTISPKPVSITGISVEDKVYDGSTTATPSGTPVVSGKIGSDDVTVSAGTASFADANAGSGKAVTFAGYELAGTKASNYSLSAQPASTTASISARPISVSWEYPASLTYSGIAKVSTPSITNIVVGDTVAPTSVLSAGKDAVNVTAEGFTYEVTGLTGSSESNYTLEGATGLTSDTKLITKAQFTVEPKENLEISKIYDGTQIVTKTFLLSDFVISELQNGEQLASVSITALYDGAVPGQHDVEITKMTFAAADMSPNTSYVASNYDIIVNGDEVWGEPGVHFIIPGSAYVLILPSGGGGGDLESYTVTTDYEGANLVLAYSNKIVKGAFGILSVTPSKNYGYTGLTVTNGTLSRLADDCYIINPDDDLEAEAVLTISVTEQAIDPAGYSEFYVSGIVASNTGANVVLRASDNGGLYAGTVKVYGTCYEIRDLEDGKGPRTVYTTFTSTKTVDVAKGDLEISYEGTFDAPDRADGEGKQTIYWVYAEYSYDTTGNGIVDSTVDTVGLLSMPVSTE
ncbi:MAG: hypothetical protein IKQ67_02850 [Candidatus Methanomethylophilaceae archaeon]|nr:hypothetical protein [Candidatus Methanomethylophilaceae archaeon]